MKGIVMLCACLSAGTGCLTGETIFVTGARPWNFPPRSRENHLRLQMTGPDAGRVQAGVLPGGATSGVAGYNIQSNSYAIGNWIQVDMHLGDGSEGLIMIENHQTNDGTQHAVSDVLDQLIESYED
ncbi:hypothetical protein [Paracoccus indicus]|uniref:hypothetical protein n=1 Tax=Paracoccus indicus TaxID=2079229 RepID=UPI0013B403BB|nr:hypothetical protein [Paracoccus indicus]